MKNYDFKPRDILIVLILSVIGILSIRYNAVPKIYYGYLFSLFIIFLVGTYTNKWIGGVSGLIIVSLGLYSRVLFPVMEKLKGKKLESFMVNFKEYEYFISKYFVLMILLGVFLGIVGGTVGNIFRKDRFVGKIFTVKGITYMSIMIAIGVMINSLRIGELSFGGFPIILSGYLFGPISGFVVGAITDVVAFMVRPSAFSFNILFVLTSGLTGLIPVLITSILGDKYPKYSFIKILIGIFIGQMLTSVIMVPIFQTIFYGKVSFYVYASRAFLKQIVSIPVYAFLVTSLSDRFSKVIKFDQIL